jgi:hypothetical protein
VLSIGLCNGPYNYMLVDLIVKDVAWMCEKLCEEYIN